MVAMIRCEHQASIEHFASVLKDVKDRGGWNTASALVGFKQRPLVVIIVVIIFVIIFVIILVIIFVIINALALMSFK